MLERPYKLRGDLKFLQDIGGDPDALLATADLPIAALNGLQPLSRERMAHAYGLLDRVGGAALAVRCGEAIRPQYLGALGFHLMNSGSIRELLSLWTRFSGAIGYPLQGHLLVGSKEWRLEFTPRYPLERGAFRWCMMSTLAGAIPSLRRLSGHDITATGFGFPFSASECDALPEMASARYSFGQARGFVCGSVGDIDRAVLTADPDLQEVTAAYCLRLLDSSASGSKASDRVLQQLYRLPVAPGITEMAASLYCSQRTLQRQLADEGRTYREILDSFRKEQALRLLRQGVNIKQLSYALGFSDAGTFRRSFRQWTGMTPSAWLGREMAMPDPMGAS